MPVLKGAHWLDYALSEKSTTKIGATAEGSTRGLVARPLVDEEDLDVEIMFQDRLIVAADLRGEWARRRRIEPAELVDASWILTAPHTSVYRNVAEAFRERGLPMPKISLMALSGHLRMSLLSRGPFVTALPSSLLSTPPSLR
jgi:DNA-binding transcriptional LysR family regulator